MSTKLTSIRFSSASPFFLPLFLIWLMDRQIAPDATDRYRPWAWGVTRKRVWFVTLTPIHRRQASSKHYIIMPLSLLHEYMRGWAVDWKRVGWVGMVGNGPPRAWWVSASAFVTLTPIYHWQASSIKHYIIKPLSLLYGICDGPKEVWMIRFILVFYPAVSDLMSLFLGLSFCSLFVCQLYEDLFSLSSQDWILFGFLSFLSL